MCLLNKFGHLLWLAGERCPGHLPSWARSLSGNVPLSGPSVPAVCGQGGRLSGEVQRSCTCTCTCTCIVLLHTVYMYNVP